MDKITSFSSLLEYMKSLHDISKEDKLSKEVNCALTFMLLLQQGILTQQVGKSDDGITDRQDILSFRDKESQCAILCLENLLHYELPENIHIQLVALRPKVEELAMLNRNIANGNRRMQEILSTARNNDSKSGCMVTLLLLIGCIIFVFL